MIRSISQDVFQLAAIVSSSEDHAIPSIPLFDPFKIAHMRMTAEPGAISPFYNFQHPVLVLGPVHTDMPSFPGYITRSRVPVVPPLVEGTRALPKLDKGFTASTPDLLLQLQHL